MPPLTLAAGVLGASFVAMQTHVVPIAGVALFTVASLAGQTAISLWVDKLGLSGGAKSLITKRRVFAAIITVIALLEYGRGGLYRDWETDRKSTRLNSSHRL